MRHHINETFIKILLMMVMMMTHCVTSICEQNNNFCEKRLEITSTDDYMELNHKYVENVASTELPKNRYPESRIVHNGFFYYSNVNGLFVRQENSTSETKIDGFPEFTTILLDSSSDLLYFGTKQGLSVLTCGRTRSNKIHVTDGFAVDFGVVDGNGNVYFGNYGDSMRSGENMFVLRKEDQRLIRISGVEQTIGSYTLESMANPNKIAVDKENNVYVGGFAGYIYLIEPNQTTAIKLKDIKSNGGVTSIVIDSKDEVYFRTNHALYTLTSREKKLTKMFELADDFNYFLSIDDDDNVYFQFTSKLYVLKPEAVTATEINMLSTSEGLSTGNFTEIQNFQVKNKVLYFTSTYLGGETIFALKPTETSLTVIHTVANSIISLAIDNSANVYFITFSNDLEKYVPFVLRKNSNIPIEIRGVTGHLSHVFADNRNNIFFGSGNGLHVLEEDEITPFKVRATESQISSFVVDKNDNVYFGTDYDGAFVLRSGMPEAVRIDGINTKFGRYVEVFGDRKYDVIYFKTGGALFKLNGGETVVKTLVEGYSPDLYLSNSANDVYYVQSNDGNSSIMSVKVNETKATNVIDVEGEVLHLNSDRFNNLFFITDNDELHMLGPGELTSKVITTNQKFSSLNIDRDNNVYFTTKNGVAFVLRYEETKATNVKNVYGNFKYFVESGDDILFLIAKSENEQGLFLVRNKLQFETIFKNRNLGVVDDTKDETIFNMLNYLNFKDNYLLNRNKNKIINKTPTSATVLATNGKFRGGFNVTYSVKIKDDDSVANFDLIELLEMAVFFDHVSQNRYNFRNKMDTRNISIFTENLRFLTVKVTQNSEPISSIEFKNICFNKKRVANTSPLSQSIKIPECKYETKETISFQVTTGLNKTNNKIEESMDPVLNSDDENVILNILGDRTSTNTEAEVTLSGAFDLSNLKKHGRENGLYNFRDDEQEIIIPPKKRILVNYSVRTLVLETKLNLRQKIKGTIIAKITHADSDETVQITIKEAMQTLRNNNILPNEISINADNSITFNGKAKLIVKRESEPKIIRNFYDI
ncbi:uncharacterized protein LOC119081672 [Bradysia coprophila]|uniref:uncharacterized protein LOC119081672 n=1 Tax=Bradysia coprophila TaxID=38358 RepID=UPI00187DA0A7|nr:uncharacterized protein LOC119081672 [Bradysia coprophila]